MTDLSLRQFLRRNRFDTESGVRHLLPHADDSLRTFMTTFLSYPNRLQAYQQLAVNDRLLSDNGFLDLAMQADGNLVLYRTQFGRALWASNTQGKPVTYLIMQADGDLVAYTADGTSYWARGTPGNPGAWAVLQDDGNLVIYDAEGNLLWASDTVQDFNSPTFQYVDSPGYRYDETSENWKQLCTAFPCFAQLQWPGYDTQVVDTINGQPLTIAGQPAVIQLWKGTCQNFLGSSSFPGGIGAEVGVYHRMPGRARPSLETLSSFLPNALAALIIKGIADLTDDQLWWAFPELNTELEFTLTSPVTN
jgi:hypothetical protein